jgi:FeS assembly protein IscX
MIIPIHIWSRLPFAHGFRAWVAIMIWTQRSLIMALGWRDSGEIGFQLFEKYPTQDPLKVRFTDLHKWVMELDEFEGQSSESNEKILEAIQMAWYEEWKDDQD